MPQLQPMPQAHIQVSVVVLNYNGENLLRGCLDSLRAQQYVGFEVIVVDNHSQDAGPRLVKENYPEFRLLELSENFGFCAGNHAGVRAAHGAYVALVNNDTVLPPDFIATLAAQLDQHPEAWIAAPKIDNQNLDMTAYPYNGALSLTGLIIQNVFRDPQMVFGAPGAALMFRKDAVGMPFDEDYIFFHEDVYLSWRTRLAGHAILYCPAVVVRHLGSVSVTANQERAAWYRYLLERNRWLNLLTFFSWSTWWRLTPLLALSLALEQMQDLMAGRSLGPRWRAYAWLVIHPYKIWRKRRSLQAQRRVGDGEILQYMSCRLTNVGNRWGQGLNRLAKLWCQGLRLKTAELYPGRTWEDQ